MKLSDAESGIATSPVVHQHASVSPFLAQLVMLVNDQSSISS